MGRLTVGEAAIRTGWSPRMLRYLERARLVVPRRTASGYRLYGLHELEQLRSLRELRNRFAVKLTDIAFAARLHRDAPLRAAVDAWLSASGIPSSAPRVPEWIDWEQDKHERLLAA